MCAALFFVHRGTAAEPTVTLAAQASGAASSDGLEVLEVRPNFFMIAGAGSNIGVQVGEDGVVVVDAGIGRQRSSRRRRDQADHTETHSLRHRHRARCRPCWRQRRPFEGRRSILSRHTARRAAAGRLEIGCRHPGGRRRRAAHDEVVGIDARAPAGLPTESFHYARKYLYLNDEAIEVLHQPAAHTDSDVFAFFRRSDVVVAGDVIDTRRFPVIDIDAWRQHRGRNRGAEPFE